MCQVLLQVLEYRQVRQNPSNRDSLVVEETDTDEKTEEKLGRQELEASEAVLSNGRNSHQC